MKGPRTLVATQKTVDLKGLTDSDFGALARQRLGQIATGKPWSSIFFAEELALIDDLLLNWQIDAAMQGQDILPAMPLLNVPVIPANWQEMQLCRMAALLEGEYSLVFTEKQQEIDAMTIAAWLDWIRNQYLLTLRAPFGKDESWWDGFDVSGGNDSIEEKLWWLRDHIDWVRRGRPDERDPNEPDDFATTGVPHSRLLEISHIAITLHLGQGEILAMIERARYEATAAAEEAMSGAVKPEEKLTNCPWCNSSKHIASILTDMLLLWLVISMLMMSLHH